MLWDCDSGVLKYNPRWQCAQLPLPGRRLNANFTWAFTALSPPGGQARLHHVEPAARYTPLDFIRWSLPPHQVAPITRRYGHNVQIGVQSPSTLTVGQ